MQPHFLYLSVINFTVFSLINSEIVYPNNQLVNSHYEQKAQNLANKQSEIENLNTQAIAKSQQGQFTAALQSLQQALAISRELGISSWEAVTFNNIGRVYQKQGQYSQALQAYQQALILNKELSLKDKIPGLAHIALGKTYSNIGYLFEIQKKPELAIFFYKHCLINRELVRLHPATLSIPQPEAYSITVAQTYRFLGEQLLKQERVVEAQRTIDLLKVEELEGYLQNVAGNKRTGKGIEILPGEKPVKGKLEQTLQNGITLGKELTSLRNIPPQKRSPQQTQRIQQLVASQQQLLETFNQFITSPAVTTQLEQISRTARRQNLDLESINEIRDNLASLPQKTVLIYPLVLKDSLELVVVTPDSVPFHRTVPVTRQKLNQTIATFRQALKNPSQNIKIPAGQLYDWLIKPIEKELEQAGTQTLIYAPDDQLRYIPLSALYNGKQWLVERFSVHYITAASLTNLNTPRESALRILAGAFTKGSYQLTVGNRQVAFSGLPFAAREVESLAATVSQTKTLLDNSFSPQIAIPQMDDYTIVHLATHAAFVVGKPQDSFILFGNGDRVNLTDIATWSLPNVDLVVLSACETGLGGKLGNGEEILGFGYQMQKTGAKAAIASLWAVDDGGTQALMSAFYTNLSYKNLTKATALRKAQIALIRGDVKATSNTRVPRGGNFNHPYYWAAFILIGNGL